MDILCHPYLKGPKMANRTEETNRRVPLSKGQKGRLYASGAVLLGLAYSTYANVRSGQIAAEPIITSVLPTVVLFLTIHLMNYFQPKNTLQKVLVWIGLGFVGLVAFGISGFHIIEQTIHNGQFWQVAIFYPIIVDVPTLLATAILIQKVNTTVSKPKAVETVKAPVAAKTTTGTAKPPAKRTPTRTNTKPTVSTKSAV